MESGILGVVGRNLWLFDDFRQVFLCEGYSPVDLVERVEEGISLLGQRNYKLLIDDPSGFYLDRGNLSQEAISEFQRRIPEVSSNPEDVLGIQRRLRNASKERSLPLFIISLYPPEDLKSKFGIASPEHYDQAFYMPVNTKDLLGSVTLALG